MSDAVRTLVRGRVLEVTLDRPKANAIDVATSRELGDVFASFRDNPNLNVAIITAAGERFFSAGWDLKDVASGDAGFDDDYGVGGFAGLCEMHDLYKPVIAAVNGMAVGGGFELALSCDLIVAAEHAEFFLPEIAVGVVADAATFRLPKWIPRAIAAEMLLTGRRMSADEAYMRGLVNTVVSRDLLLATARDYADTIANGAPLVVSSIKEILRMTQDKPIEECYRMMQSGEFEQYEKMKHSQDALEGPKSFAEKRDANWKGR